VHNSLLAYLKNNYLPLYGQHFIDELVLAAGKMQF
jgi:hypothetical protein